MEDEVKSNETVEEVVEEESKVEEVVEEQSKVDVEEDVEPPIRKSVKDYIIERKDRKIAKLEEEHEGEKPEADKGDDIRSIIRQELDPILKANSKSKDEEELQSAFQKFPEAKKIEKTVRKYMENEAYSKIPVEFIVRGLLGAKEIARAKADDEAKATRQGGHGKRPTEMKEKNAWDLTPEEFDKEISKVMSGQNN